MSPPPGQILAQVDPTETSLPNFFTPPGASVPLTLADERRLDAAFETTLEIEGRAAWLAQEIAAGKAGARDARLQIAAMGQELSRHGGELPDELLAVVGGMVRTAQAAAMVEDLGTIGDVAARIRTVVESYRAMAFA